MKAKVLVIGLRVGLRRGKSEEDMDSYCRYSLSYGGRSMQYFHRHV